MRGFVWHANQPGHLAWTQQDESGTWSLRFGEFTDPEPTIPTLVAEFDEPVSPAYWDEERAVLLKVDPSDDVPEIVILGGEGQTTAPPGAVLSGVLPGGRLLMGRLETGESFLFDQ